MDFFYDHGYVIELLVCTALFVLPLKRRGKWPLRVLCAVPVFFGVSLLWGLIPFKNWLLESVKYILFLAMAVGAVLCVFRTSFWTALFCEIGAGAMQHSAFKAGELVQYVLGGVLPSGGGGLATSYVATEAVVYAIIYFMFARRIGEYESTYLENRQVLLLGITMLLFVTVFHNLFKQYSAGISLPLFLIYGLFDIICCAFMLWIQYGMYKRSRLQQEYGLLEHMLYLQKQQLESSKENIDLINVKCHDLKKQIALLSGRISQDEIKELNRAISIYDSAVKTGNDALDVLLAEKSLLCERENVTLNCIADGKSLGFMTASDIYSLFGNALDNAIEAVLRITDAERRCIGMNVKRSIGMVVAHFENYYDGALSFDDGLPVTTKDDKRYHGFGMKSIKMIAEKYGGYFSVNAGDGVFNLNILLPVPKLWRPEARE